MFQVQKIPSTSIKNDFSKNQGALFSQIITNKKTQNKDLGTEIVDNIKEAAPKVAFGAGVILALPAEAAVTPWVAVIGGLYTGVELVKNINNKKNLKK